MADKPCVLIMAGGTGGHVFPALSVAGVLSERGVDVHWLGTAAGIEARLVPAANIPLHCLNMAGLRGKNPIFRIAALFKAGTAVLQSMRLLRKIKPFCVIGLGGLRLWAWRIGRKNSGYSGIDTRAKRRRRHH